jgi:hypothetical protein
MNFKTTSNVKFLFLIYLIIKSLIFTFPISNLLVFFFFFQNFGSFKNQNTILSNQNIINAILQFVLLQKIKVFFLRIKSKNILYQNILYFNICVQIDFILLTK